MDIDNGRVFAQVNRGQIGEISVYSAQYCYECKTSSLLKTAYLWFFSNEIYKSLRWYRTEIRFSVNKQTWCFELTRGTNLKVASILLPDKKIKNFIFVHETYIYNAMFVRNFPENTGLHRGQCILHFICFDLAFGLILSSHFTDESLSSKCPIEQRRLFTGVYCLHLLIID